MTPTLEATLTPTAEPTEPSTDTPVDSLTLRIWVPPQFDPEAGTRAGDLLAARLQEFEATDDNIQVEVRVKAAEGTGGLLASLTAAHAAAPLALPDLIALPRADLETAAIKGLVAPLDGLTPILEEADWYAYAVELARLQENHFGIPFAGDTLTVIYRPAIVGDPPQTWADILQLSEPLTFPAAAPNALFPLALYLSAGGSITDEAGRPSLSVTTLTEVLNFIQSGERSGVLPFWLTQYDTFDVAKQAYRENRAHLAVTWISDYLVDPPIDTVTAAIPTPDGTPFTLARGWVWALSNQDENRNQATVELAEFLADPEFMGSWTEAAGHIPTRSSALNVWPASPLRALVSQMVIAGQVVPPMEVITILGPVLQEATVQVLKEQANPATAARQAAEQLAGP